MVSYVADDRLAAGMHMDVLDANSLLATSAQLCQRL
jgi:hypothetical protein